MCGRFTLHHDPDALAERFATPPLPDLAPRYNVAPAQPVAVVTQDTPRRLEQYHWGLIPAWAKDKSLGHRMINARAETLAERPAFRTALKRRRCLIPADGFYEWREADNPDEGGRTPLYFRRADGALFAFAGLWDEWRDPATGQPLRSCAIVTSAPNPLVAPIHDRMPVVLRREDEGRWLDPSDVDTASLLSLLAPAPGGEAAWEAYPVSRRVNAPTVDDPSLVARV